MKTNKDEFVGRDEVTIISSGVLIEGKLKSGGNVRVDGNVKGDVNAGGNVTVGENGEINGEINADTITIGGKVIGTVNAKEKLVLEDKAVLKGDIYTKILVIEAGANFDGNSHMDGKVKENLSFKPEPPSPEKKNG